MNNTTEQCQHCGAAIKRNAKFCEQCGVKVEIIQPVSALEALACPQCGRPLKTGKLFCGGCGYQIQETLKLDGDAKVEAIHSAPEASACPQCGRAIKVGKSFCGGCGYQLQASGQAISPVVPESNLMDATIKRACPQCSQLVPSDSKLCPYCSLPLKKVFMPEPSKLEKAVVAMYLWSPWNKKMQVTRFEVNFDEMTAHFLEGPPQKFKRGEYKASIHHINQSELRIIHIQTNDSRKFKFSELVSHFSKEEFGEIAKIVGVEVSGLEKGMLTTMKILRHLK